MTTNKEILEHLGELDTDQAEKAAILSEEIPVGDVVFRHRLEFALYSYLLHNVLASEEHAHTVGVGAAIRKFLWITDAAHLATYSCKLLEVSINHRRIDESLGIQLEVGKTLARRMGANAAEREVVMGSLNYRELGTLLHNLCNSYSSPVLLESRSPFGATLLNLLLTLKLLYPVSSEKEPLLEHLPDWFLQLLDRRVGNFDVAVTTGT